MSNNKETMNTTDHDLLIGLNVKFETFTKQYHLDMKSLNDGMTKQITENTIHIRGHEKRLDELERIVEVVRPEETTKDYLKFKQDIKDIILRANTLANVYRVVAGIIGGLIMWVITQLPSVLQSWGVK